MPRLAALLVACLGLASALTAPKKVGVRQLRSKPEFAPKALEVRGGGMVDKTQYVKVSTAIYGIYALQFFFMSSKFMTDHFEMTPDPLHVFLCRGAGLSIAWGSYLMSKMDPVEILPALVVYNILVGLVYPWNAAYISKLPVKYPMHYLPEALMAVLTVAGLLAL